MAVKPLPDIDGLTAKFAEWAKSSGDGNIDIFAKKIRLDYLLQYGAAAGTLSRIRMRLAAMA